MKYKLKKMSVVTLSGFALFLSGCSSTRELKMTSTSDTPAARGTIKATETEGNNTQLEVSVHHLAPAQKIAPGSSTYVVWIQPSDGTAPKNVGAMTVNSNLEGKLTTITPYRNMSVFITPERIATTSYPTGDRILTTPVFQ